MWCKRKHDSLDQAIVHCPLVQYCCWCFLRGHNSAKAAFLPNCAAPNATECNVLCKVTHFYRNRFKLLNLQYAVLAICASIAFLPSCRHQWALTTWQRYPSYFSYIFAFAGMFHTIILVISSKTGIFHLLFSESSYKIKFGSRTWRLHHNLRLFVPQA